MAISMHKKGVELTLQTIVVAAILLVVAIVLISIFVSKMGKTDLNGCSASCDFSSCPEGYAKIPGECESKNPCCQLVFKNE